MWERNKEMGDRQATALDELLIEGKGKSSGREKAGAKKCLRKRDRGAKQSVEGSICGVRGVNAC